MTQNNVGFPEANCIALLTLLGCQSEWPKDKPFLLMHSMHARNSYNSKIEIISEITLFIHLNKHLDRHRSTLWKKFTVDYCLPLLMNTFGPQNFDFHAWVKKCHISLSEKLPKFILECISRNGLSFGHSDWHKISVTSHCTIVPPKI